MVKRSTGQIFGTSAIPVSVAAPGVFANGTGLIRAAAVLNQDGSANSPSNPAERGSVISIFATGRGFVANAPPDGEAPTAAIETQEKPRVFIGTCYTDDCNEKTETILYSGLAPQLVGVWQINVRVPQATVAGPQVPIVILSPQHPEPGPEYLSHRLRGEGSQVEGQVRDGGYVHVERESLEAWASLG